MPSDALTTYTEYRHGRPKKGKEILQPPNAPKEDRYGMPSIY